MKKIFIVGALLMVMVVSTSAWAGPKYRFFDKSGQLDPEVTAALNLTNDQSEKIEALHEEAKKELIPLKAQFATKRAEMRLLWTQPTLDADKIKATQKELQTLGTRMRDIRTDMRIAFRKILTPEQTSTLLAMGFGKNGRFNRRGGYGKGQWGYHGKSPNRGNWGPSCEDCPRYKQSYK